MAKSTGNLPGLVELNELLEKMGCLLKGKHRRLATGDDEGVEVGDVDLGHRFGVFHERRKPGGGDESHADEISCRVTAHVARVAHRVGFAPTVVGTEDFDSVAYFLESKIGVRELRP